MDIPAVVAAVDRVLGVPDGSQVILDADQARLHVAPEAWEVDAIRTALTARKQRQAVARQAARELCTTADGARIEVFANLGAESEAAGAVEAGAEGCGLLRTEFLFLDRDTPPDEAEQRRVYQVIADALGGRPLIVRTLDIGGDKPVAYLPRPTKTIRRSDCAVCAPACGGPTCCATSCERFWASNPPASAPSCCR